MKLVNRNGKNLYPMYYYKPTVNNGNIEMWRVGNLVTIRIYLIRSFKTYDTLTNMVPIGFRPPVVLRTAFNQVSGNTTLGAGNYSINASDGNIGVFVSKASTTTECVAFATYITLDDNPSDEYLMP